MYRSGLHLGSEPIKPSNKLYQVTSDRNNTHVHSNGGGLIHERFRYLACQLEVISKYTRDETKVYFMVQNHLHTLYIKTCHMQLWNSHYNNRDWNSQQVMLTCIRFGLRHMSSDMCLCNDKLHLPNICFTLVDRVAPQLTGEIFLPDSNVSNVGYVCNSHGKCETSSRASTGRSLRTWAGFLYTPTSMAIP